MLTKYECDLINYWKNWKPGMGPYGQNKPDIQEVEPVEINVDVDLSDLADDIGDRIWDIL